ncbi:MAG: GMC family oxidoreductase [Mucilaginibacter sp.]
MESKYELESVYDLCIIGSGPAGIILALEYSRICPNQKILLIEYGIKGQPAKNSLDDSIKNMNTINHHDPYECTNKGLGGSSATWGGRCVMYDEIDFTDRKILKGGCTWNEELLNHVDKFLPIAAKYFDCGTPIFNLHDLPEGNYAPIADNFKEGIITDSYIERWSLPTRFGSRYADDILNNKAITLIEGFEARDFLLGDNSENVSSLIIRNVRTDKLQIVNARNFVLAAGGQETTRLLLRNPALFNNIGGVPASLGKYYQGHLSGKIASVKFKGDPQKTEYGFQRDQDGTYIRRRFQFTARFLKSQNLLNTAIWLDNPLYFDPQHRSGAMSLMYLIMITPILGKKLAPPAIAHSITKGKITGIRKHLWNIIKDLPGSLITPASIFYKRYVLKRKLPGVFLYSPDNRYALHFHAEQIPDINNKMKLDDDGETLIIEYGFTDEDIDSVIKLHETLDEWLRQCNCGELEYWFTKEELPDAIKKMSRDGLHQCGTTRIATSPEQGVVDSDLKLWGLNNIFVCSSSVFPTSGQANPTFILGAFAARLAEHLSYNS